MARAIAGFFAGCLVTGVVVWFAVLPDVRESYVAVGRNDGAIAARAEIVDKLHSINQDDVVPGEDQQELFSVKATSVVIVERNGVKTLRIIQ